MEKSVCEGIKNFTDPDDFTECPTCGNHICLNAAKKLNFVCPNCYSRMNRIG